MATRDVLDGPPSMFSVMSALTTITKYRSVVQNLRRQYAEDDGDDSNLAAFVAFCEGTFPSLLPATIRFYARALEWHFEPLKESPDASLRQLHHRFVNLKFTTSARRQLLLSERTSAVPSKHCSIKKFERVLSAVADSHSVYALLAQVWLVGGLLLGLRPCEWPSLRVDEGNSEAVVDNAKQYDGERAFPGSRTIRLVNWSHDQISVLHDAIFLHKYLTRILCARGHSTEKAANLIYSGVRGCIRKACRSLNDSAVRVSLYSLRHQCIANHRRGSWALSIAVVMGHRVETTHQKYYGRIQTAERALAGIQASKHDIETVLKIQEARLEKKKAWARRDAAFHAREIERQSTTFSHKQLSLEVEEQTNDELQF